MRLTRDPTDDDQPAFSPDGARIAFRSGREGGGIYMMPALGGEPRLVVRNGISPQFSPDGKYILHDLGSNVSGELYVVPASGGSPVHLQPQFWGAVGGTWAPDSRHLLFLGMRAPIGVGRSDWCIATMDSTPALVTTAREVIDRYGLLPPPGEFDIVPSLWLEREDQVVFSARLGDTHRSMEPADFSGHRESDRSSAAADSRYRAAAYPSFAVASSTRNRQSLGMFALANLNYDIEVWGQPLDANLGVARGEFKRLTHGPSPVTNVSVSRDGERAVFSATRSGGTADLDERPAGRRGEATYGGQRDQSVFLYQRRRESRGLATREGEKWSLYALSVDTRGRTGTERRLCEGFGLPGAGRATRASFSI